MTSEIVLTLIVGLFYIILLKRKMDKKWTDFSQTIENIRKSLNTLHHLNFAHTLKKYSGYVVVSLQYTTLQKGTKEVKYNCKKRCMLWFSFTVFVFE